MEPTESAVYNEIYDQGALMRKLQAQRR
jgi:hypothetical protein